MAPTDGNSPPPGTPAPPAQGQPQSWDHLKRDPETWDQIQQYAYARLRGSGTRIKELEAELDQARQQSAAYGQGALDHGEAMLQHQQLHASVEASLAALEGQVPADRRTLIPAALPPAERLQWMTANLGLLTTTGGPPVNVVGNAPRAAGPRRGDDGRARMLKSLGFGPK